MIAFFNYPSNIIHWGSDGSWNSSLAQSPQRFPAQPWPSISSRPARSSPGNCILWNQIQKATCYSFAPKYGAPKKPLYAFVNALETQENGAQHSRGKDIMGCLPQIDRGFLQSSCGLRSREPTFASSPKNKTHFKVVTQRSARKF